VDNGELITDGHATETTNTYWEQAHPKPLAARQSIERIVKRALIAGYTSRQIVGALNKTKAFTVNAIEYQLRLTFQPSEPPPVSVPNVEWIENVDGTVSRVIRS
jgi:hypothetical protein